MSAKNLYRLSEVCSIVGIKSYVLRFWESEFTEVKVTTSSDGQKLYDQESVEAIAYIKKLLFEKKYTIEKAKQLLSANGIKKVKGIDFSQVEKVAEPELKVEAKKEKPINHKKMAVAKKTLSQIITLTKSIKESHNWK